MEFSLDMDFGAEDAPDAIKAQIEKLGSVAVEIDKNTYTFGELWKHKDEEQKFLIPELLPDSSVSVLIGEDGIGKTQILTQLCLSICLGHQSFMNLPLHAPHKSCLIVATEDSRQKFTKAAVKQLANLADIKKVNPDKISLKFTEGSNFDSMDEMIAEIVRNIKENPVDLIVIDALSDLFTLLDGEINSNTHARKIISKLQHLCNTYNVAIILIHHAGKAKLYEIYKSGSIFVTKDSSQGAGAITQKPRTILALSNDKDSISTDGKAYTNYLHVVKANLMGKQYVNNALKLAFDGNNLCHKFDSFINIEEWIEANGQSVQQQSKQSHKPQQASKSKTIQESFVFDIFGEGGVQLSKGDLVDKISAYFVKSKPESAEIMLHLLELKMLEEVGGVYIKFGDVPF